MADHRIRLRGAWERHDPDAKTGRRVSLPLEREHAGAGHVRLIRPFNRPPLDPERERLLLEMEGIAGLVSVRLNQQEIARPEPGTEELTLTLDQPLPMRNVLSLEVEFRDERDARLEHSRWGTIALVIRPLVS